MSKVINNSLTTRGKSYIHYYSMFSNGFDDVHCILPGTNFSTNSSLEKGCIFLNYLWASNANNIYEKIKYFYSINNNLMIAVSEDSIDIKKLRDLLKELCGESSVFICRDAVFAQTISLKGYTMSLTLPIWNEGETIGDVLESFLPVADEIIVGIDSKTTDNSFEICKKYSDDVFLFEWEESFAKARNRCIERCTSDWIFMTEGHEFLDPASIPYFAIIKPISNRVHLINVSRYIQDEKRIAAFPWLIRNNVGIKYVNDVHNAVQPEDKKNSLYINFPQIKTIHIRSEQRYNDRKKQRNIMNKKVLLNKLKQDHNDSRSMFYLANEYLDFKDYENAIYWYEKYLSISEWKDERYEARLNLAKAYSKTGNKKKAIEVLLKCFLEDVPRCEHMVYLGDLYAKSYPDKAIYYYKMATTVEITPSKLWLIEPYYKEVPWQKLTMLYASLGDFKRALDAAYTVKNKWPDTEDIDCVINMIEKKLYNTDRFCLESGDDFINSTKEENNEKKVKI